MKCKACKREIPDESIFCLHCGEKLVKSKAQKKTVSIPKPRQLASGEWIAQIMIDGRRHTIKGRSLKDYEAKAKALKQGIIEADNRPTSTTLQQALRSYIDSNDNILSPSTIRGYEIIYRNRFKPYMNKPLRSINFQSMINEEAALVSPKTVSNAWGLVSPALAAAGFDPPEIKKPRVPESDEDWLDYEQIKVFLEVIRGHALEPAALLALHGLRLSELLDLDVSQISDENILVKGATVINKDNRLVHKATNKNKTSRRVVPVLIPRLLEVLPSEGKAVTLHPNTVSRGIRRLCLSAGLPECSAHDLRRSFASLAYHLKWDSMTTMRVGGWSNLHTVEKVYRKLAEKDKNADIEKMLAFYTN